MPRRACHAAAVTALLLLWAAPGAAEVESAEVRTGVAAYDALDYEAAVHHLERALGETLTTEEQCITYRTLAFARVALNQIAEANRAFESLLGVDPTYEPDRTISPRIRAVFEEARAAVATRRSSDGAARELELPLIDTHLDPLRPVAGQTLNVEVRHPGGLARRLWFFYRPVGEAAFVHGAALAEDDGVFRIAIPGFMVARPGLEYYAVVLDERGAAVARRGTLADPHVVAVDAAPRPGPRSRWRWWTAGFSAAALALIGTVAGGVIAAATRPTSATVTFWPR